MIVAANHAMACHEVLASERIARPYDEVRAVWLADPLGILQRATTPELSALFGAKLCVPVGPLEIACEIVVDVVSIEQSQSPSGGPATKLVVEWGAMRWPAAFPTMRATISIYPFTAAETTVDFHGTYEPPLGVLGEAVDAIAMHHAAKQSVARLLRDVAQALGRPVSAVSTRRQ